MSKARSSLGRTAAAHAVLIAYTAIALFPVVLTIMARRVESSSSSACSWWG